MVACHQKTCCKFKYHAQNLQVSPCLRCSDTCKIWMLFKGSIPSGVARPLISMGRTIQIYEIYLDIPKRQEKFCKTKYALSGNKTNWSFIHGPQGEEAVFWWWRHQMEIFSALLAFCMRGIHRSPVNSPHKGQWRGAQMFFFYMRLNKRLTKQSCGWRFETPSRSVWRHCNIKYVIFNKHFVVRDIYQMVWEIALGMYLSISVVTYPKYGTLLL